MSRNTQTVLVILGIALIGAFIGDLIGFSAPIIWFLGLIWSVVVSVWEFIGLKGAVIGIIFLVIGWVFLERPVRRTSTQKSE
jgi:hypothetical protein